MSAPGRILVRAFGSEGIMEDKPLANWIKASLTGFFRRLAMLAIDLLEAGRLLFALNSAPNVRKVLNMSLTYFLCSSTLYLGSLACYREVGC